MPTTKEPLPTYNWYVRFKQERSPEHNYLHAAYFQDEGDFYVFKDGYHKSMYVVAKAELLDVGRLDPNTVIKETVGR